tara:strand:- start:389 stop:943 length:555 start_codon:yes stop_codon:yes gene_type:complete
MNKTKWISLGVVGSLFAVSHIGMIGYIATREKEAPLPSVDLPVGPYTSYKVSVEKDRYAISYKANDPKTMYKTTKVKEKGGFLGLADENQEIVEEYTMEGDAHIQKNHIGSPVASEKNEACVKAIGSAEGTGRLVGTSVGAAAAPTLSTIPFVGWVAAGWVAMFGGNQGAEIGGNMAEDLNKNC